MVKDILEVAVENRYKCTQCTETIRKGNKYFRDAFSGWRSSHTVNICSDCIVQMFLELKIADLKQWKKDFKIKQDTKMKKKLADSIINPNKDQWGE